MVITSCINVLVKEPLHHDAWGLGGTLRELLLLILLSWVQLYAIHLRLIAEHFGNSIKEVFQWSDILVSCSC